MSKYELARLTDYDFELLCKSIIEAEEGQRYEVFSRGADRGIDLRFNPNENSLVIVQCKHWIRSDKSALISHLKTYEKPKVEKLKPTRYVIFASVELNPAAKEKIKNCFSGYIHTTSDIWGLDEIAAYLNDHPKVVQGHPRLWLSNTTMLESVLHKDVYLQSQVVLDSLPEDLLRFAVGPPVNAAEQMLEDRHVCVISGVPGIGKSTLAKYLLARLVADGYQLISLNRISDGLKVFAEDEKQVFFHDDFLGKSQLGDNLRNGEDSVLLEFIKHVGKLPNKRFILTTREYILAQAKDLSEILTNGESQVGKIVLDLAQFTYPIRAQILYNHLYFSSLERGSLAPFAESDVYDPILNHSNFSPRIVEAAISSVYGALTSADENDLPTLMLKSLDNPSCIWEHMYNNQIENTHRDILSILYLAGGSIEWTTAFQSWKQYRGQNPDRDEVDFGKRVKHLVGTLVTTQVDRQHRAELTFHNPSVRDYLTNRLVKHPTMLTDLAPHITDLRSIENFWLLTEPGSSDGLWSNLKRAMPNLGLALSMMISAETPDLTEMTNGWGGKFARLLSIARDLDSQPLWSVLAESIDLGRPEYQEDWTDCVSIISAVRSCEIARIRELEPNLIEWFIQDINDTLPSNGWDLLKSASEVLSEIGGDRAEEELAVIEEKMDEFAVEVAESMLDPEGSTYDYVVSKELLERLDNYMNAEEIFAGYAELSSHVRKIEGDREEGWRNIPTDSRMDGDESVASMMSLLKDSK